MTDPASVAYISGPLRADITPLEGRELFNGKSENGPALEIENDGGLHLAGAQPVNGRQGNFKIGFARRSGSELGTALEFQKDISRTIEEPLPGITEWMNLYPQVRFDDLAMLGEAVDDSRWTHGVSLASYTVAVKIFKVGLCFAGKGVWWRVASTDLFGHLPTCALQREHDCMSFSSS